MRTYRDAKVMAKSLRQSLADKGISLTHSDCLHLVAQEFGFDNWNVLSAKLSGITIAPPVPYVRIHYPAKAREFYVDFLGFTVDWEHRYGEGFPLVLGISRSDTSLMLTEHHGDGTPGIALYIPVRGIAEFHAELTAKNYPYAKPGLEESPIGGLELCVTDPFGNQLRFHERG